MLSPSSVGKTHTPRFFTPIACTSFPSSPQTANNAWAAAPAFIRMPVQRSRFMTVSRGTD
ncbi:hypothetical protein QUB17_11515 [Microcoleus sp. B5-C4]|uniref:hypothetical protein n=1 Tax=Microcoleus sp. B5-C4 TaxID=2818675 RepID=UPI002FCF43D0